MIIKNLISEIDVKKPYSISSSFNKLEFKVDKAIVNMIALIQFYILFIKMKVLNQSIVHLCNLE